VHYFIGLAAYLYLETLSRSKVMKAKLCTSALTRGLQRRAALFAVAVMLTACGGGGSGDPPPVPGSSLSLTGPARAVASTRYSYQASPADASGISWNWGDGTPDSSGATAQKVWHKPGSFSTTLQALVSGQTVLDKQAVRVIGTPIAAGLNHTCAVQPSGSVRCWGYNASGQLGDGSNTSSVTTTVAVMDLSDAVALAAGLEYTCALQSGGGVRCWGSNNFGQLGNGSSSTSTVAVTGLANTVAVAAGFGHACALQASGSVRCWGNNELGQLGNGATASAVITPVAVVGLSDAVALTAGGSNTCALQTSGSVRCWGFNTSGQLGNGSTATVVVSPVTVSGLSDAVAVATSGSHTCALQASGGMRCWGNNQFGQLGDGSNVNKITSIAVNGLTDAVALTVGAFHTCALQASGSVRCWGNNDADQLGNGSTVSSNNPVAVTGLADAAALAAGFGHTCALQVGGDMRCWGSNLFGQLGDGTWIKKSVPTPVVGGAIFWK
jgi:alpha-tubulin suppressor-like RCC1 family protein